MKVFRVELAGATPRADINGVPQRLRKKCDDMATLMRHGCPVFEIEWTGDYVPSGAQMCGFEVVWTQHGIVRAKNMLTGNVDDMFGSYERLSTTNPQRMRVWVQNKTAQFIAALNESNDSSVEAG